jgi:hypothetical protein
VEKYGTAGQAADGNVVQRMPFARWIYKAADTCNSIFYDNNGYENSPQCYVYTYTGCLVRSCGCPSECVFGSVGVTKTDVRSVVGRVPSIHCLVIT